MESHGHSQRKRKMKKFRDYLVEFDAPTIYCDMDGVLADFVKFTREHLGQKFTDENWHDLPPDMFYQLPPMPDAKQLWRFIGRYNPNILTAIPREGRGPISERAYRGQETMDEETFWCE